MSSDYAINICISSFVFEGKRYLLNYIVARHQAKFQHPTPIRWWAIAFRIWCLSCNSHWSLVTLKHFVGGVSINIICIYTTLMHGEWYGTCICWYMDYDAMYYYNDKITTWSVMTHTFTVFVILHESLQRRNNGCDGVSNHQPRHSLLNRLFRCRSKKTSKLRVTGLCTGNSPVTDEFPVQMASNAENVSIWWHHHDVCFMWYRNQFCPGRDIMNENHAQIGPWMTINLYSGQSMCQFIHCTSATVQNTHSIFLTSSFRSGWPHSLRRRHNERNGVSNHQPHHCLLFPSFIQPQIKENMKSLRQWPLWGDRWPVNSRHKGPVTRKIFPFDDVIMNTGSVARFRGISPDILGDVTGP